MASMPPHPHTNPAPVPAKKPKPDTTSQIISALNNLVNLLVPSILSGPLPMPAPLSTGTRNTLKAYWLSGYESDPGYTDALTDADLDAYEATL